MNLDEILAYCCIGIAVVIFGTNFIPVKKIATGDGLFFQASVCHGQFSLSFLPHFAAVQCILPRITAYNSVLNREKVNSLCTYMAGGTCNLLFSPDL